MEGVRTASGSDRIENTQAVKRDLSIRSLPLAVLTLAIQPRSFPL
jgi:hypothetical protein